MFFLLFPAILYFVFTKSKMKKMKFFNIFVSIKKDANLQ